MIKAGIVGATGYAGAELVRLLCGHPEVKIAMLASRQYAGAPFSDVYPSMRGHVDMACETCDIEKMADAADVAFMALPHGIPMEMAPELIRAGKKVIDLSADFRFRDLSAYEGAYQRHTAPDLAETAVYGLCEIYRDEIRQSPLIGNPGCYPTSFLLPVIPLVKSRLADFRGIVADSKSGVSGAGRSPGPGNIYCAVNESFKPYKADGHRHLPEMEEILSREAGEPASLTFVPHLLPISRGMLTTAYLKVRKGVRAGDIRERLAGFYADSPFVRILPDKTFPDTLAVKGTNRCDIGFHLDEKKGVLVVMSAIDNLVKGASGQAVQNMNIMFGLDETAGLNQTPYPM
ncbi:N-acetyl-gamma-glutamyl-phosphate reductase [Candidatus Desulfarcum epimagneticum]|uniref:N-acetyl-gamma-glutamyl-phosphate reductase n=1 Tax=uncultured Desulfobacteraceae bacterium TaxID=218296 RepID=A0A484HFG0_9BACT|nr:N-acetyl-gamma-glutamyl-phosphate reductase [uncultured Desulfobacteraceae bacterium]